MLGIWMFLLKTECAICICWDKHEIPLFMKSPRTFSTRYGNMYNEEALCEGNPLLTDGFPLQKAYNAELRYFLWCTPGQTIEQTEALLVIWDAMTNVANRTVFERGRPLGKPLVPLLCADSFPHSNRALCHFGTGLCYEAIICPDYHIYDLC